jgi:RHS repeat-associated protein
MEMAGRGFHGDYRFGYQGSEKDNEVSGDGNSYTTEFRQLDPRLGRWFSVDPVFQPWQTPYCSMDNDPINLNDPLGLATDPEPTNPPGDAKDGDFHIEGNDYWVKENGNWIYGGYITSPVTISKEKKNTSDEEEGFWANIGSGLSKFGKWLDGLIPGNGPEEASDSEKDAFQGDAEADFAVIITDDEGEGGGDNPDAQKAAHDAKTIEIPKDVLEAFGAFAQTSAFRKGQKSNEIKKKIGENELTYQAQRGGKFGGNLQWRAKPQVIIKRVNLRTKYLGRTPGKISATGKKVIDRMKAEGKIRTNMGKEEFQASDGNWYPLSEADMAHKIDAVSWWNSTGRNYGAKSKEVRTWMLDSDNYYLEHFSINRSQGAKLKETYLDPK